ncbi:transcriptional regulator, PucR family domain protein [Mycobacterium ulcerans str. Harvey]|uniref:Transcriptional regulator, PucR family domain protein n=1 Tax=Mycobacterium ulcerans str. Harvey TaxID=1299332 RepID=A0ABN0R181_MYCUL|nr:transcriptional regulator, PucR family domain protein [Mycobacterium ulcerans str. Harvey]
MLAAPLQNLESDGNANRGVLERLGKQALRGFESVHQRVAMGVQQPRGTRCIALL